MTDICQKHITFRAPKQNKSLVNIDENFLETLGNFQSHKRHKNKSRTEKRQANIITKLDFDK